MIMKTFSILTSLILFMASAAYGGGATTPLVDLTFNPGKLKPVDSLLKVKVGQMAPDFILPSIAGGNIRLSSYRGKQNVVLSFIPAAWTPVCSEQWPGYNITKGLFRDNNAVPLGI